MEDIIIRPAVLTDAAAFAAIYRPYVENTAVSFEYVPPDALEFQRRMTSTLEKYPYLAAERDGEILGYAYSSPLGERPAYGWAAENSVYVRQDIRRRGVGAALYAALEKLLTAQGAVAAYACIACTDDPDEYLSGDSVAFHKRLGYVPVGRFHGCGCKFDRWYDIMWMEKQLAARRSPPPVFRPFDTALWCEVMGDN